MRPVIVGGAQMGPAQKSDQRSRVVERMIDLLDQARGEGCTLVVYPELALTTFFPRWYMEDQGEVNQWFEREMPGPDTQPLFDQARDYGIAISFGYAELTPQGQHFNSSILTDRQGKIVAKYRKVHLPGHSEFDPDRAFQHLEKRYFLPGDLGFPVTETMGGRYGMAICNDRRWPETYRVMGLRGVEMILLGYNTPSVNSQKSDEGPEDRLFHSKLVMQAGAYQNSTWVVGIAKGGSEDGNHMIGGSVIISPDGKVMAEAKTEGDELIVHNCDLDDCNFGKQTMFNFSKHRRIEHYGSITSQVGVELE
jgi:N-carbamoyl-D-amino-acid hydrolase